MHLVDAGEVLKEIGNTGSDIGGDVAQIRENLTDFFFGLILQVIEDVAAGFVSPGRVP